MTETMKLCGLEEAQVNAMIEDLTKTEGNLTLTMETMPGEVHLLVTLWSPYLYHRAGQTSGDCGSRTFEKSGAYCNYRRVLYRRRPVCQNRRCSGSIFCV